MRITTRISAVISGVGLLFGATGAMADHITLPLGAQPYAGTMTVSTLFGLGDVCDTEGTVDIGSQTSGTLTGMDFSGTTLCDEATVVSLPNSLTRPSTSSHTITAHDLSVDTSVGTCYGDLDGRLTLTSNNTIRLVYRNADSTLSGGLFGSGCNISGHLDLGETLDF